ncbi:hypothetical protein LLH00_13795, partial [bacterium]|nr:hypothetical protein [bacterium]
MRTATLFILLSLALPMGLAAQWTQFAETNRVRAAEMSPDRTALWCATGGGLVRYDTVRHLWRSFGRNQGLPATDLNALLVMPDGSLILGSEEMGLILGTGSGRWTRAGSFDGLPGERVLCLARPAGSDDFQFWAGTGSGARQFSLEDGTVSPVSGSRILLEDAVVYDIACAADGAVWFASSTGLWRLSADGSLRRFGASEGVGALGVTAVEAAADGSLYAAWRDTVKVMAGELFIPDNAPNGRRAVTALRSLEAEAASPRLALAAGGHLYLRGAQGWSEAQAPAAVTTLGPSLETDGLPVAGTDGAGLLLPEAGGYSALNFPGPLYNLLTRVAVDSRGTVWCSSASDATPRAAVGVNRWDGNLWTHFSEANSPLLMNMIASLNAGPDGRMYLGTWFGPTVIGSGGFNILDDHGTADSTDDHWETYTANETPLSMGVIRGDMAFDSSGGVWVGSQFNQNQPGGLERFDTKNLTFSSYAGALSERAVRCVAADGLGNIWIGYQTGGLGVIPGGFEGGLAPRQVSSFTTALGQVGVLDMAVDPANRLWIVTPATAVVL